MYTHIIYGKEHDEIPVTDISGTAMYQIYRAKNISD